MSDLLAPPPADDDHGDGVPDEPPVAVAQSFVATPGVATPGVVPLHEGERVTPAGVSEIPSDLLGRLTVPAELPGHYIVLWARKPQRGQRPDWREIGYVKASGPSVARARVLEHDGRSTKPIDERGTLARYLIEQAGMKPGILLRAVPAVDWAPDGAEPWSLIRREPELGIG